MVSPKNTFNISIAQTHPEFLRPEANRKSIVTLAQKAKGDLVVFPELATSGYNFRNKKEASLAAEKTKGGPLERMLRPVAESFNKTLIVGFVEKKQNSLYNSALIVTPQKSFSYQKRHLFWREKKIFSPGKKPAPVFKIKGILVGVMICFDWLFPEVTKGLAQNGAQVIAHPSNLVLPYAPMGMKTRSLENAVFSATANRVGKERNLRYIGKSQILGVKGETLVSFSGQETGIKTVSIRPALAKDKNITPLNHIFRESFPSFDLRKRKVL